MPAVWQRGCNIKVSWNNQGNFMFEACSLSDWPLWFAILPLNQNYSTSLCMTLKPCFFLAFIEVLKKIFPNIKFFTEEVGRSSLESTRLISEGLCFQWQKTYLLLTLCLLRSSCQNSLISHMICEIEVYAEEQPDLKHDLTTMKKVFRLGSNEAETGGKILIFQPINEPLQHTAYYCMCSS